MRSARPPPRVASTPWHPSTDFRLAGALPNRYGSGVSGGGSSRHPRARKRAPKAPVPDAVVVEALRPLVLPQTWLARAPRGSARRADELVSHVGGRPYAGTDGEWPECPGCDRPLTLVGELALGEGAHLRIVPARLCTVFLCGECAGEMSPDEGPGRYAIWLHDEVTRKGRVLTPPDDEPDPIRPCRLRRIDGRSLPLGDALTRLSPEASARLAEFDEDVFGETWHELTGVAFHGSVIGGYGLPWVRADGPPECPSCGKPEAFLGAIHGADCEPWDGDHGPLSDDEAVAIHVCPRHPGAARLALLGPERDEDDGDGEGDGPGDGHDHGHGDDAPPDDTGPAGR